jgi:hypothetical protein
MLRIGRQGEVKGCPNVKDFQKFRYFERHKTDEESFETNLSY